jgi:hypothetical protein
MKSGASWYSMEFDLQTTWLLARMTLRHIRRHSLSNP